MVDNAQAAADVAKLVAPAMKELGFRKQRKVFNRPARDGIIHVAQLNLQPSWGMNEGTGSWMFGVVVPRMQAPWENTDTLAVVPEYRAQLRNTQGAPLHRFDTNTGELMTRDLLEIGLPWLERFPDEESVVREWEADQDRWATFDWGHRPGMLRLYAARGNASTVERMVFQIASQPMNDLFHGYVVDALVSVGRDDLLDDLPPAVSDQESTHYHLYRDFPEGEAIRAELARAYPKVLPDPFRPKGD